MKIYIPPVLSKCEATQIILGHGSACNALVTGITFKKKAYPPFFSEATRIISGYGSACNAVVTGISF